MRAAELTGTVINRTVQKPAAGDDVILLKLAEGMQEVARTKTDAQGRFTLPIADSAAMHLVRVNHRNVNYHRPAPPGAQSVEVEVFDAAENVEGITQSVDILRLEADATTLRVLRMFALNNASSPPRTLMSAKSFEFVLPEGAKLENSVAAGPGGMPVQSAPIPTGEKGHYTFLFPIRPGETRFQIAYSLPYNGKLGIAPQLTRPTQDFAVSYPQGMSVEPQAGSLLQPRGEEAGMKVLVANNAQPGDRLAFIVSGTGAAPLPNEGESAQPGAASAANRPGGGIGEPINTPDPINKYRWWILSGVALLLAIGGAFTIAGSRNTSTQTAVPGPANLRDALKEELFQLEADRLEGRLSQEEYARLKAAFDAVLQRSLSRNAPPPAE